MRQPTSPIIDKWFGQIKTDLNVYADKVLTREDLVALAKLVGGAVTPGKAVSTAFVASLAHLIGKPHSRAVINRNIRRVLANWHFIDEGMTIPDWDGSSTDADAVVIGVKNAGTTAGGFRAFLVLFKLKTGLVAGITRCSLESERRIEAFLQHDSGCANYSCAPEEIAGMRVRVTVSSAGGSLLKIEELSATSAQKKLNKELCEARSDVTKCGNPIPCNACGKTIEECPLAVWLKEVK